MRTRITINEPLTLEKLRELQKELRAAPTICPKCSHPAHRAFRCGVKVNQIGTPVSGRTCDCNVTFELNG